MYRNGSALELNAYRGVTGSSPVMFIIGFGSRLNRLNLHSSKSIFKYVSDEYSSSYFNGCSTVVANVTSTRIEAFHV